jgi:ketosteroid isomerase-like protein
VSDGMSMAPKIEACIMVVRALWTPMKAAQQAKNQLRRIGITMIGAVLNGISHSRGYYPYYYGYYRYYAYKYTYEEDNEPGKRKLSIREIGLSLESGLKSGLQAVLFAVPHYTALLLNFAHHLLRKKTFWILLAIMACVPFVPVTLRFFGAAAPDRKITYVDKKEPIRYLGFQTGTSSLEAMAPGQKLAPAGSSAAGPAPRDTLAPGTAGPLAALSDSLRLWQQAFNEKNVRRYLSFYDTARFKYPGGGFSGWKSEKNEMLLHAANSIVLVIDSIRPQPIALPFFETDCSATVIAGADTTHREYSIIWQQTADTWRIVREKYREHL